MQPSFTVHQPLRLLSCFLVPMFLTACVHSIQVSPSPSGASANALPYSVLVEVPFVALQGADHRQGITHLDWPAADFKRAAIDYLAQRGIFRVVGTDPADLTLTLKTWLFLTSRERYHYRLHIEADLGMPGKAPMQSYAVDGEATGSSVRWVTASDRDPIQRAVQAALDELGDRIEEDRARILK